MSETVAKDTRLDVALYLEGVRVPFRKATVRSVANSPAGAVISLVPLSSALMIRPRTLVHILYWDEPYLSEADRKFNEPPKWRLLFEGETTGIISEKDSGQISIQLTAEGHSNYYRHCYQFMVDNAQAFTSAAYELALFSGNNSYGFLGDEKNTPDAGTIYNTPFFPSLGTVYNTIAKGLDDAANKRNGGYKNPLIGLLRILEYVGGSPRNRLDGVNRFFKDAQTRLKIMEKIFFFPDDEMTELLFQQLYQGLILQKQVSSLTGIATLQDIIQSFLSTTGYDEQAILAPPFGTNPTADTTAYAGRVTPPNTPAGFNASILSTIWKPKTHFLPPPACNILFPNRVSSFRYQRNYLSEPTRMRTKMGILPGRGSDNPTETLPGEWAYYSPPALQSLVNNEIDTSVGGKFATDPAVAAAVNKATLRNYGFYPTGANLISDPAREIFEAETGIIPIARILDVPTYFFITTVASDSLTDPTELAEQIKNNNGPLHTVGRYLLELGDYSLDTERFVNRELSVDGPFAPDILAGFPGVVLDITGAYFGEFSSVTHTLSGESGGTSTTAIKANYARHFPTPPLLSLYSDTEILNDIPENNNGIYYDPITKSLWAQLLDPLNGNLTALKDRGPDDFPPYLNRLFRPANIGSSVYAPLGTRDIFAALGVAASNFTTQAGAAISLLSKYLVSDDKDAYARNIISRQRQITTSTQLNVFYGNSPLSGCPVSSDALGDRKADDLLFFSESKPIFQSVNNGKATKRAIVQLYTKHLRIFLGREPGVTPLSVLDNKAPGTSGNATIGGAIPFK